MNIKSVLRTYSLLRQLTDDEAALLETLRNFNDSEREALIETLSPQSAKSAGKKGSKKAAKSSQSSTKSPRATGIEQQLSKRRERVVAREDDEDGPRCTWTMGDDGACDATEHSPIHREDGGYLSWHPFQPAASPAPTQSPANGAPPAPTSTTRRPAPASTLESDGGKSGSASLSTVDSGIERDDAGSVAGAGR